MRQIFLYVVTALMILFGVSYSPLWLRRNIASIIVSKNILTPVAGCIPPGKLELLERLLKPAVLGASEADKRIHLALGLIYDCVGEKQRSIKEWKMAESAPLWEHLVRYSWSRQDLVGSIEYSSRAIAVAPERLENYFVLAYLYWPSSGQTDEAIDVYTEILSVASAGSFERYMAEGYINNLRGQWATALNKFERAAQVNPTNNDAHRLAASVAVKLGLYPSAIEHLTRAVNLTPDDSWIYVELGDVYQRMEQFADASFWYSEAIRIYPENPGALRGHASLSKLYLSRGLKNEAIAEYKKVLELDPHNAEAQQALSQLLIP